MEEDEEIHPYQRLVRAIIIRGIRDLILPFGTQNTRISCKQAYNFLFNEESPEYKNFCFWCDLANFDMVYWQKLALMNLAYELNFKPWLRLRIVNFLKGIKYWQTLKNYYCVCCEKEYHNFLEAIENEDNE